MKENNIFTREQLGTVKPPAGLMDSFNKGKFNDFIPEWHIENTTMEKKSTQTKISVNNKEDQGDQYPLYF